MRKPLKTFIAAGIIAASVAGAPMVFAATQSNKTQGSGQMDHMMQDQGQMQGQGQMGNGMGMMNKENMMPMMQMMQMMTQMNQMMATCNQMMQGMMKNHHGTKSGAGSDKG